MGKAEAHRLFNTFVFTEHRFKYMRRFHGPRTACRTARNVYIPISSAVSRNPESVQGKWMLMIWLDAWLTSPFTSNGISAWIMLFRNFSLCCISLMLRTVLSAAAFFIASAIAPMNRLFSVPLRLPFSWEPPVIIGARTTSFSLYRTPIPLGPYIL